MWKFIFVLHNLSIRDAIGNDYVAIVPASDPRIKNIIAEHDATRSLNNFTNQRSTKRVPSVIDQRYAHLAPENLRAAVRVLEHEESATILLHEKELAHASP